MCGKALVYFSAMKPLLTVLLNVTTACAACLFPTERPETFWAQEYVGADLLREMLEERDIKTEEVARLVAIWDSPSKDHGEHVSHLIASPYPSAAIPLPEPLDYLDVGNEWLFVAEFRKLIVGCITGIPCPAYINHSMRWNGDGAVAGMASAMGRIGIAFITTAGNKPILTDETKRVTAVHGRAVLVGSLDTEGNPSDFTGYAPEVTVSAPSGTTLATYDFSGEKIRFGKTSGANSMTTSTLTSYTLESGI